MFWSYGPDEVPLQDVSRHYADLNLHIETENYNAGELVDIEIALQNGRPLTAQTQVVKVKGKVGDNHTTVIKNVFANTSMLNLLQEDA